jgi:hypothetical protein
MIFNVDIPLCFHIINIQTHIIITIEFLVFIIDTDFDPCRSKHVALISTKNVVVLMVLVLYLKPVCLIKVYILWWWSSDSPGSGYSLKAGCCEYNYDYTCL